MPCCPWMTRLRCLLALMPVAAVLIIAGIACSNVVRSTARPEADKDQPAPKGSGSSCPMLGCTPARNMANTVDRNIPAEFGAKEGEQKNIKWTAEIGRMRCGYMSPVIAGGKVYVATNNSSPRDPNVKGHKAVLMCFREADGKFLWQIVHDMPSREVTQGGQSDEDGLLSAPCVEGDRLYYLTPAAVVVCASTDGKVIWQYDMMKELKVFPCFAASSSPLVAGDGLFLVTGNGRGAENEFPSPDAPSFVALDKKTGKLLWKDNSPGKNVMEGQWTSPAYGVIGGKPQVIFPGGDGWVYSFEPTTGKLIWKFDCNPKAAPPYKIARRSERNPLLAAPVIFDNKVYIGTGRNPEDGSGSCPAHFWCIDATKTGDISPVNDNFDPKAEANKKSGLVWHYGGPIVPRPKRGRDIRFDRTISPVAIHDGLVYVTDLEGVVYCFDAKTGQKHWEHDLKAEVWGSPYYVDGKVLVATGDGEVNVFPVGKTPPKNVQKNEFQGRFKATPVAANGVLYVVTEDHLYAIANKQ